MDTINCIKSRKMKAVYVRTVFAICFVVCFFTLYTRKTLDSSIEVTSMLNNSRDLKMKYILLWTSASRVPFVYMGRGQDGFVKRKCSFVNCFVTSNSSLLKSVADFDAIMFAGPELSAFKLEFPDTRSTHQKYVFASIESARNYDIMDTSLNRFFNWTSTYKLDSDIRWGYIVVKNLKNNVIGPRTDMNWLKTEDMHPVTKEIKAKLRKKRKIAAWIVSNCLTDSYRESFFDNLQRELRKVYRKKIDVYGECGLHVCKKENQKVCNEKISRDYYFYLAFENSFSEDYVTEKLLLALQNNAIPIVYGGANYTRFMPNGIYLNAVELGVKKLAAKMVELMNDPEQYAEYFKWQNHYKYQQTDESPDTNEYCKMCELLNDKEAVKKETVYWNFTDWWNPKSEFNVSAILNEEK